MAIKTLEELKKALKQLIDNTPPEDLCNCKGLLTNLKGYETSEVAKIPSEKELGIYRDSFKIAFLRATYGGKKIPQVSKIKELLKNKVVENLSLPKKKKNKKISKKQQQVNFKLEDFPDLENMFFYRAINHLIMGELRSLDSLVGDEGCQLRAPFILDMHQKVKSLLENNEEKNNGDDAKDLVLNYRKQVSHEQRSLINKLKYLQKNRVALKESNQYEKLTNDLKHALPKSKEAASQNKYKEMIQKVENGIKAIHKDAKKYLIYCCSETLYWYELVDRLGVPLQSHREEIFSDSILSRRKSEQSQLSRSYIIKITKSLAEGYKLQTQEFQQVGYEFKRLNNDNKKHSDNKSKNKKNSKKNPPTFYFAEPRDHILSQLLLTLQLHSAHRMVNRKELALLPAWETIRLVVEYALHKGYPLIVPLIRLEVTPSKEEPEIIELNEDDDEEKKEDENTSSETESLDYCINLQTVLYYKPTKDGFQYIPNPNLEEQTTPGLVMSGFSILSPNDKNESKLKMSPWLLSQQPSEFLKGFTDCDISKLILTGIINHKPLHLDGSGRRNPLNKKDQEKNPSHKKGIPFNDDPGGFKYSDEVHKEVIQQYQLKTPSKNGQQYLTENGLLSENALKIEYPSGIPISVGKNHEGYNIREEYALWLQFARASGLTESNYVGHVDEHNCFERLLKGNIAFIPKHALASTWRHEKLLQEERYKSHFASTEDWIPPEKLGQLSGKSMRIIDFKKLAKDMVQKNDPNVLEALKLYITETNLNSYKDLESYVSENMLYPESGAGWKLQLIADLYDVEIPYRTRNFPQKLIMTTPFNPFDFSSGDKFVAIALKQKWLMKTMSEEIKKQQQKPFTPSQYLDYYYQINNLGPADDAVNTYTDALIVNGWLQGESHGHQLQCLLDTINQLLPPAPNNDVVQGWDKLLQRTQGATTRRDHHITNNENRIIREQLNLPERGMLTIEPGGLADGNRVLYLIAELEHVEFLVYTLDERTGLPMLVERTNTRGKKCRILFYGSHFIPLYDIDDPQFTSLYDEDNE